MMPSNVAKLMSSNVAKCCHYIATSVVMYEPACVLRTLENFLLLSIPLEYLIGASWSLNRRLYWSIQHNSNSNSVHSSLQSTKYLCFPIVTFFHVVFSVFAPELVKDTAQQQQRYIGIDSHWFCNIYYSEILHLFNGRFCADNRNT